MSHFKIKLIYIIQLFAYTCEVHSSLGDFIMKGKRNGNIENRNGNGNFAVIHSFK